MFRFSNPEYFYLLLVIPLLIGIYWYSVKLQKKQIKLFGNFNTIMSLIPGHSFRRVFAKFVLVLSALVILIVGLAGPQFGSKLTEVKRKGIEIIIALDVSNSMMAQDIQPNRIERAKQSISQLVDKLTNDRIGLIVFSGDAYIQLPITNDYASAKMFLSSINPGIVSKQGTAIGSAIELATSSFSPDSKASRVIVVISDGENHEDDPLEAAKHAAEQDIVVHTIGIGSPDGAPIPFGPNRDYLKDSEGKVVVTRLDEETLSKIAVVGNGKYVRATNSQLGLVPLFENINKMQRSEFKDKVYSEYNEQFQYIFALTLLLLLVDFMVLERKNAWAQRINLFGTKK